MNPARLISNFLVSKFESSANHLDPNHLDGSPNHPSESAIYLSSEYSKAFLYQQSEQKNEVKNGTEF